MGRADLPNLNSVTDQLRVDNNAVGNQSEAFIVGGGPAAKPASALNADVKSSAPDNHTGGPRTATDVFPWMRAYGCLGRKTSEEK